MLLCISFNGKHAGELTIHIMEFLHKAGITKEQVVELTAYTVGGMDPRSVTHCAILIFDDSNPSQ